MVNSNKADNLMRKGKILHQKGKLADAKKLYRKALVISPAYSEANHMLGVIALQQGEPTKAIDLIQKSIEAHPYDKTSHFNIALAFQTANRQDEAVEAYKQAISLDPHYLSAISNLGSVYMYRNELTLAEQCFRKAIGKAANTPGLLNNLGLCLFKQGDVKGSIDYYKKALAIEINNPETHNNLGRSLQMLGEIDAALQCYRQALSQRKNYPHAASNLAYAYDIKCDEDNAIHYYNQALNSQADYAIANTSLAAIFCSRGELDKSRSHLSKVQNINAAAYTKHELTFIDGYRRFLDALLNHQRKPIDLECGQTVYAIGDSHCLSFANAITDIFHTRSKIESRLVRGCKAWHLANSSRNEYKVNFENKLTKLPHSSIVLLFFGEIDCRLNEGIIPYTREKGLPLKSEIQQLVRNYVFYTQDQAKPHDHKLYYFNLPAPKVDKSAPGESIHAEVIALFNQQLNETVGSDNVLDTYHLTNDDKGFSTGKLHIDGIHLVPEALQLLPKAAEKHHP